MFRSLFFAVGIFLLIFGAQTLIIDKWIMSYASPVQGNGNVASYRTSPYRSINYSNNSYYQRRNNPNLLKPVYQTQEWMPWSLLAAGTIIVLYSISTWPVTSESP